MVDLSTVISGLSVAYLSLAFLFYNFLGIFVPIFPPPLMTLLGCGFLAFVAQQLHKRSHSTVHGYSFSQHGPR